MSKIALDSLSHLVPSLLQIFISEKGFAQAANSSVIYDFFPYQSGLQQKTQHIQIRII